MVIAAPAGCREGFCFELPRDPNRPRQHRKQPPTTFHLNRGWITPFCPDRGGPGTRRIHLRRPHQRALSSTDDSRLLEIVLQQKTQRAGKKLRLGTTIPEPHGKLTWTDRFGNQVNYVDRLSGKYPMPKFSSRFAGAFRLKPGGRRSLFAAFEGAAALHRSWREAGQRW